MIGSCAGGLATLLRRSSASGGLPGVSAPPGGAVHGALYRVDASLFQRIVSQGARDGFEQVQVGGCALRGWTGGCRVGVLQHLVTAVILSITFQACQVVIVACQPLVKAGFAALDESNACSCGIH